MIRISEPTNQQIEEARARLFLADLKKALRDQNIRDAVLELSVDRNIHNQMVYSVHATRGGLQITGPEGGLFTPSRIPRSLSLDCWPTTHSALPGSRRQSRRTQPRDALLTLTPVVALSARCGGLLFRPCLALVQVGLFEACVGREVCRSAELIRRSH
ncbi:hypothetical protein AHiyo1_49930 [Arthrobacter sp. Hiyo1]|nr:hypothetical protein AHiyo1_49930 [Arthrobacter sp. Hiyo1]